MTATTTSTRSETSGLSFLQTRTNQIDTGQGQRALQKQIAPIVGMGVTLHASLRCYPCHGFGHYAIHCPVEVTAATTGAGFLHIEMDMTDGDVQYIHGKLFTQTDAMIPYRCTLLDIQSTICIFNHPFLLKSIRPYKRHIRVITNRGYKITTQEVDLDNFGTAWCNPQLISNIL